MWHDIRRFCVADLEYSHDLLNKLKGGPVGTWCLCTGWRLQGWLWLNDSTNENADQEYALVHEATMVQWESLTISWMDRAAIRYFTQPSWQDDYSGPYFGRITNKIDAPAEHGRCLHCM